MKHLLSTALLLCITTIEIIRFKPLDSEWWHFTLKNEPYPDTYFTFPVY